MKTDFKGLLPITTIQSELKKRLDEKQNIFKEKSKSIFGATGENLLLRIPLKNLSLEELQMRLKALDPIMEREIEELRQRYTAKRQPILDAMDAKKRRQQNF